jgi:hypothetical protein
MRSKRWWALVGVLAAVSLYVGKVLATPQMGVTTNILAKTSFDPLNIKARAEDSDQPGHLDDDWQARIKTEGISDVYVVDNKFAAADPDGTVHGTTGWHRHPGPSLIHVVAGSVTNYSSDDPTCSPHTYTAGQGFIDSGTDAHILRNEGTVQAETIAMQFLPQGAMRRIDVTPAPGHCPFDQPPAR